MIIEKLVKEGWLKTPEIINAFKKIKRVDFLREKDKALADLNQALSIDYGQTISQPLVVAFMLELLQPEKENKILDIGSGSGWTSALLAEIVGRKGKIIALEIISELVETGKTNIAKYNFIEKETVEVICADGSKGWKPEAFYDRIICSASSLNRIPEEWKNQLKIGGRIVAPVALSLNLYVKKSNNEFEEKKYPGFTFVPLVSK
jgi:protein-L-isoaspartate(D-aspartate) O-methyltransferase